MGEINPNINNIFIDLKIYQSKKCIIFISQLMNAKSMKSPVKLNKI